MKVANYNPLKICINSSDTMMTSVIINKETEIIPQPGSTSLNY